MIDAMVAPAPKMTNKAGNAQQIKVEDDANKLKKFVIVFLFICNFIDGIACTINNFCD